MVVLVQHPVAQHTHKCRGKQGGAGSAPVLTPAYTSSSMRSSSRAAVFGSSSSSNLLDDGVRKGVGVFRGDGRERDSRQHMQEGEKQRRGRQKGPGLTAAVAGVYSVLMMKGRCLVGRFSVPFLCNG